MSKKTKQPNWLTPTERVVCFVLSALSLAGGITIYLLPPTCISSEISEQTRKITTSTSDVLLLVGGLWVAAVALAVFAINGIRAVKFGIGSVSFEGDPQNEDAKKTVAGIKNIDPAETVETVEAVPVPEPHGANPTLIETEKGTFEKYEANEIPATVLKDALSQWNELNLNELTEVEYALRKQGRGNHPWILRLRDRPPIVISYGGQGKTAPTVTRGQ